MTENSSIFPRTIGMDLGSRSCSFCCVDESGVRLEEGVVKTLREELQSFFKSQPSSRVAIEASGPSRWISELAQALGHEVVVANPREFHLISKSHAKNDRNDARILAEFGQFRPHLLKPVRLRGLSCQIARATVSGRALLIRQRTQIINFIRAQLRHAGEALPVSGASYTFHQRVSSIIPEALRGVIQPQLAMLESIAESLLQYDRAITQQSAESFPEVALLQQVKGVGPITALTFAATIEDPARFPRSRDLGPYLGLAPRSYASGSKNPQLSISKRGDSMLRTLLVNAATHIMSPRGQDSNLRRFGLTIQERGGQAAKAKARIAVARKLAVLLHRLLVTAEVYDPNRGQKSAVI